MKIFIDLTSLDDHLSGLERFAANIALSLLELNCCEIVAAFKNHIPDDFKAYETRSNVRFIILESRNRLTATQIALPLLLRKLRRETPSYDAFYFPAFPAPLLFRSPRSVSAIHDMGCFDCPYTMTLHSRIFFRTLYRKSAKTDGLITTVSEFSRQRIAHHFPQASSKISVVGNGIAKHFTNSLPSDQEIISVRQKYSLPSKYILSLSTLEPRKNLSLLLESFGQLLSSQPIDCKLVLAGRTGWKNDQLNQTLAKLPKDSVVFTGFVDDSDLPAIYAGAEFFVFPSMYEGFGLPPLEALASGTAVLSSDAASMPEVLGEHAVYFRSGDATDLTAKLSDMLSTTKTSADKKRRITHACSYNWAEQAQKLLRTFETLK